MADDFATQLMDVLKTYTKDVEEDLEQAKITVAKDAVKRLKKGGGFKNRTGKYNRGWAIKKDKKTISIWNSKQWYLTHLLEAGHAKRNGGRTKAFVHIEPVNQYVQDEFEEEVRKRIGG